MHYLTILSFCWIKKFILKEKIIALDALLNYFILLLDQEIYFKKVS